MKKLFVPCIDNGGGMSVTAWAISMVAAFSARNFTIQSISFPYPDGALNVATADFMRSDCDEMVIIDTDLVFGRDHLDMLLAHDVPLVFGLYPKKQPGLVFPVMTEDGENPFGKSEDALVEVSCVARGFMKVRKEVFEALQPVCEQYIDPQTGRQEYLYWQNLPGGHSEDFAFCDKYRSIGGKVLVDQRITLKHAGMAIYPIPGTF